MGFQGVKMLSSPLLIKRIASGGVELLFTLPIFVLLAWGATWLSFELIRTGKLERYSWIHSLTSSPPDLSAVRVDRDTEVGDKNGEAHRCSSSEEDR